MELNFVTFCLTVITLATLVALKDDKGGSRTSTIANKAIDALKSLITKK